MPFKPDSIASSARKVQPFLAMQVFERAQELERAGVDVVHLEIGEPDFAVPACVAAATVEAARSGATHYTHSLGVFELRSEIAAYYARRYAVEVEPERVVVTSGTSGAMVLLAALLIDAGDEVLLPNPGYACYDNFVHAFHGLPTFFDVSAEDGFRYDPARIERAITAKTKAVFLNSPSNPTAAVQSRETLTRIAKTADRAVSSPALVSDEIYHALEYGEERATSVLEVTDEAFVIDGCSKRYAMTGLRVGWIVAPKDSIDAIQRLQQNLFVCPSSTAQAAAIAALRDADDDVARMLESYRERRRVLLDGLERLGFRVPCEPMGAYYILVDARHLGSDSLALAHRILEEAHVGVTPGIDFGTNAEGYLRFGFANSVEKINEALGRLARWRA